MEDLARLVATGGTVGLIMALLVALWYFATGRGRVGSMVDKAIEKREAERDKREAELIAERDAWKVLAQGATPEIARLANLLESAISLLAKRGAGTR